MIVSRARSTTNRRSQGKGSLDEFLRPRQGGNRESGFMPTRSWKGGIAILERSTLCCVSELIEASAAPDEWRWEP